MNNNNDSEFGKLYKLNKQGRWIFTFGCSRTQDFLHGLFMLVGKKPHNHQNSETLYFVLLTPEGKKMSVYPVNLRYWFFPCWEHDDDSR